MDSIQRKEFINTLKVNIESKPELYVYKDVLNPARNIKGLWGYMVISGELTKIRKLWEDISRSNTYLEIMQDYTRDALQKDLSDMIEIVAIYCANNKYSKENFIVLKNMLLAKYNINIQDWFLGTYRVFNNLVQTMEVGINIIGSAVISKVFISLQMLGVIYFNIHKYDILEIKDDGTYITRDCNKVYMRGLGWFISLSDIDEYKINDGDIIKVYSDILLKQARNWFLTILIKAINTNSKVKFSENLLVPMFYRVVKKEDENSKELFNMPTTIFQDRKFIASGTGTTLKMLKAINVKISGIGNNRAKPKDRVSYISKNVSDVLLVKDILLWDREPLIIMSIFDREYSKEYTEVYTIKYNNRVIDYSLFDEEFLTLLIYYSIDIDCVINDMIAKKIYKEYQAEYWRFRQYDKPPDRKNFNKYLKENNIDRDVEIYLHKAKLGEASRSARELAKKMCIKLDEGETLVRTHIRHYKGKSEE